MSETDLMPALRLVLLPLDEFLDGMVTGDDARDFMWAVSVPLDMDGEVRCPMAGRVLDSRRDCG